MDKENISVYDKEESKEDRQKYSKEQVKQLERQFAFAHYPTRDQYKSLGRALKVSERKIQVWFQNRRARQRRIQKKASGIPENPLPNMLYRLSANYASGRLFTAMKRIDTNVVNTVKEQSESSFQENSVKVEPKGKNEETQLAKPKFTHERKRSVRTLSDVHDDDLMSLMQNVDWDNQALNDDVFQGEIENYINL